MVLNETLVALPEGLVGMFGGLVTALQALGWAIIFYIIFNIVSAILNRKQKKEIAKINKNLEDIKRLLSKKKK